MSFQHQAAQPQGQSSVNKLDNNLFTEVQKFLDVINVAKLSMVNKNLKKLVDDNPLSLEKYIEMILKLRKLSSLVVIIKGKLNDKKEIELKENIKKKINDKNKNNLDDIITRFNNFYPEKINKLNRVITKAVSSAAATKVDKLKIVKKEIKEQKKLSCNGATNYDEDYEYVLDQILERYEQKKELINFQEEFVELRICNEKHLDNDIITNSISITYPRRDYIDMNMEIKNDSTKFYMQILCDQINKLLTLLKIGEINVDSLFTKFSENKRLHNFFCNYGYNTGQRLIISNKKYSGKAATIAQPMSAENLVFNINQTTCKKFENYRDIRVKIEDDAIMKEVLKKFFESTQNVKIYLEPYDCEEKLIHNKLKIRIPNNKLKIKIPNIEAKIIHLLNIINTKNICIKVQGAATGNSAAASQGVAPNAMELMEAGRQS